jgi:hypothetical protein
MARRDALFVVAALVIVLMVGLVVKPIATGQPVGLGVPIPFLPTPTPTPTTFQPTLLPRTSLPTTLPTTTVPTTTPVPTWGGQVTSVGFGPPGNATTTPVPTGTFTHFPDDVDEKQKLLTYATISAKQGGVSSPVRIPFPYWEIHYTVEPQEKTVIEEPGAPRTQSVSEVKGSQVFPYFYLDVVDANDPTHVIRSITPSGGLDPKLWKADPENDPRPWVEKFYEGPGKVTEYQFVVSTYLITGYTIEVKVPQQYLGKY